MHHRQLVRDGDRLRGGPVRIVAFGGGTGLPVLLAGLRDRPRTFTTAVVTVADDGGSSGRLRAELGVAPPGDLRNCLVALAGQRELAEVFGHRFSGNGELRDHAVGNLILAALTEIHGDLAAAVLEAGRMLQVAGRIYPAAGEGLTLLRHYGDGSVAHGEARAATPSARLTRVEVQPDHAAAPSGAIRAIEHADLVVLASGSLFTSTIAALLGAGTREALARFGGPVVYVANLMTEPAETAGFAVADHVRAIAEHAGPVVTDVLVPAEGMPRGLVARYRCEGAAPVRLDPGALERLGVRVRRAALLPDDLPAEARHDPGRLADAVLGLVSTTARAA